MLFQVFLVDRLQLALFKSSLKIFVLIGFLSLVPFNAVTATVGCQCAIIPVHYFRSASFLFLLAPINFFVNQILLRVPFYSH